MTSRTVLVHPVIPTSKPDLNIKFSPEIPDLEWGWGKTKRLLLFAHSANSIIFWYPFPCSFFFLPFLLLVSLNFYEF
jgi:hypothetical protein